MPRAGVPRTGENRADDVRQAVKDGRLKPGQPIKAKAQGAFIVSLLRNRGEDSALMDYLSAIDASGISRRELQVMAALEYHDVQRDMEPGDDGGPPPLAAKDGYKIRLGLLEAMRKLMLEEDLGSGLPDEIVFKFDFGGADRKAGAGAELKLGT